MSADCLSSVSSNSTKSSSNSISSSKNLEEKPGNQIPDVVVTLYKERIQNILNANIKRKDYYKKIRFTKDGHFKNKNKPSININDYLMRIIEYTEIEFSTLVISLIYLERLCNGKIFLNEYNIHRIMLLCVIMAYKYNEDSKFNREYLSKIGGISEKEIAQLEHEFFDFIDYKFFIENEEFIKYKKDLLKCNTEENSN